jgi:hypothetical protein
MSEPIKLVPRIEIGSYNLAIKDALREMQKFVGPTHASTLAVKELLRKF